MKTRRFILAGSALLVSAISATTFAQNTPRSVSVNGDPVADAISYSEPATNQKPPLDSVVTFLVTIKNEDHNTLNKVRYEPTFFYSYGGSSTEVPGVFLEDPGSPCKFDSAGAQGVVCNVGQLQAQSPTTTFAIFFKSPLKPEGGATGTFSLGGKAWFAEGTTDNQTNSSADMPTATVDLGTTSPTTVQSGVRKGGGSVFTGTGGVPTDIDKNVSLLSVPPLPGAYNYGFSKLNEDESPCSASSSCLATFLVAVTDKEGGTPIRFSPAVVTDPLKQYIVVTLRRDDTLFTGSIAKAQIWYKKNESDPFWTEVYQCAQVSDPLSVYDRCIYDRRVLKASDPEVKADPSLKGVAQFKILEKENGVFAW